MTIKLKLFGFFLFTIFILAACGTMAEGTIQDERSGLEIVATTTFIGDAVSQITGDIAQLTVLLEAGQNPHSYQPTPQDMVKISHADVIFVNGLDLEEFLDALLDGSDATAELIVVSDGIRPLGMAEIDHLDDEDDHAEGNDPHVWFDPNNMIIWTENIVQALSRLDPDHAAEYQANGQVYQEQLIELDSWIRLEVDRIPESQRKIVTDHISLTYFADEYGFTQIGAVIPALTTEAETSGQELARLIDTIREHQVGAIFIGIDFDPSLAQRAAEETGVDLIPLYFGSLSDGAPASTYLDFMRYDVKAIVSGLE